MILRLSASLTAIAIFAAGAVAQPAAFTYQGQLKQAGVPVSGAVDLDCTLWDADMLGNQVGSTLSLPGVTVTSGLFTVQLNFGAGVFDGGGRWLELSVNGTTLTPRQEVTPAPYAVFAMRPWATSGADISYASGNVGIGTSSPAAPLDVIGIVKLDGFLMPTGAVAGTVLTADDSGNGTWQSVPAAGLALPYVGSADVPSPNAVFKLTNTDPSNGSTLWCQTEGTNGIGVYSSANATTGFAYGGLFTTASTDGRAVFGQASAASGFAIGGRFGSLSTGGAGAQSTASATTGPTYGVIGESFSTTGTGVLAHATASSGATYGLFGQSDSTTGSGVYGYASSTTGFNFGGHFFSNSPDGRAVRAVNNATSGQAVAGRFATGSPTGISIWSTASATSGVNYGVYGDTNSAAGYGGYFRNSAVGDTALWADGLAKVKTLQILGGADLAEPFNVTADAALGLVRPGMVVIIDEANPGDLRLSDRPYDTRVAGIVSGANGLEPGMVMKAEGKADGAHPVAMTGRVWCYVDASFGAIRPGDRLTTSTTPGHAMKADDAARCGGAVIGKAMSALPQGDRGLVLVLVNLQ